MTSRIFSLWIDFDWMWAQIESVLTKDGSYQDPDG